MSDKYNFSEREQYWREFWRDNNIYKFNPQSGKPFYVVDTPPPYVSADHLHAGHIMSYSQAEFVVRYKRMAGFEVFYPMGFDDNGLPTERFVEKKYNINKNKILRTDFVKKCLEETKIGSQTYKKLWELLGISVDWSKTYSTINSHSQRVAQWSFVDLYQKEKMVRRDEPTYWCTSCQTAVAQADLEDKEEESFLNFINFKMIGQDADLLIATSRPEMLPACVALFVNTADERYKELIGMTARVPIFAYEVPILADETVDIDFGTGLMMVCTWGDSEDVDKVRKFNLPDRPIIKENGRLNNLAGDFENQTITEARKNILIKLDNDGALVRQKKIFHNLNIHERCGTPIELVKAKQWFIKILDIKSELLKQAEMMNWHPKYMKNRYDEWVKSLKWEWCISRQRYYGVPFPVWYCANCGEIILPDSDELPIDPLTYQPNIDKCPKCSGSQFIGEKDVMDTWMTSSLTPLIIANLFNDKNMQTKLYPASLRPQAFEIIRTWLFYSVVKSFYHFGKIPFKDIMISGHGHDQNGQKISKRLGNFVPPEKIIEQYGADALRYWATGANLGENLRYNESEVKKGRRTVTKLFNAGMFCFGHFSGEDYSQMEKNSDSLLFEDRWILNELNQTINKTTIFFESYEYAKARNEVDSFFWNNFCDNYLEFVKYRLYDNQPDEIAKKVLYLVFWAILRLYAPFLPFITEELYQIYFKKFESAKSVHQSEWPKANNFSFNKKELAEFKAVILAINEIRKYKSDKKISLAAELAEFNLKTAVEEKYFYFIKKVMKINQINVVA